ncbi:MAG: SIMPL domain-containing protein [Bacteroidota bacterium]
MLRRLLLPVFVLLTTLPVAAQERTRTISVSGEAEILVIPDEVILQLEVETRDADLRTATDSNQATIDAVAAVAMRYGVPAQRIQTERIDLRPEYSSRRREDGVSVQVLVEYRASRAINVTLRDLDVFDDLMRDAIGAGVNRINGVEYRTTDLRNHRDNARMQAIDAAREKAEALAGRLGQTLGQPLTISEAGFASTFGRVAYSQNVISEAPAGAGVSTSPGQISIRANVSVVFELAD